MSAVTPNAPTVTPTPTSSAPSGPAAKSGVSEISMPAAVKYASSAAAKATKAGVNNRSSAAPVLCCALIPSHSLRGVCQTGSYGGMTRRS